ncbi:MAG: DUF4097 family beta strand repeat-containing protein [Terracidiphilus sp.]
MSTTPPNMPPAGGAPPPFPPYDSKNQWRVYKEQQKAAWRAQRDAWRTQQRAMKANYIGVYGPRVPSVVGPIILITVGIIALLLLTGHIAADQFWGWYGHWWPLLLIAAGLALLGEWMLDLRRETPVRRGGSFVGIIILLAILGFCAAGSNNFREWGLWHGDWGNHGGDFFNTLGLPEHDFDPPVLKTQIPSNANIQIENPRGDVSITAGDVSTIEVQAHDVAYTSSESEAQKIYDSEKVHFSSDRNQVELKLDSNSNGRVNLAIIVPKSDRVSVNTGKGDVTADGLGSGITVTAQGDVHLSSMSGVAEAHFSGGKHDFSVHDLQGDVTAEGDLNDLTLSGIKGKVAQNGEILGDVHMEDIGGSIHLHTSVTDMQLGELPGDLTLNSDDLRVNEAKGPVRVVTHSKDVDLSQIGGDSYVEDRDGSISVEPAGLFGVSAKNSKGDVNVTLPPNASAKVTVRTHNGDIVSDFPMPSIDSENKLANFQIGGGTAKIDLTADNGDVRIKKGADYGPAGNAPAAPKSPSAPPAANARHLKTPKELPAAPVAQ